MEQPIPCGLKICDSCESPPVTQPVSQEELTKACRPNIGGIDEEVDAGKPGFGPRGPRGKDARLGGHHK